MKRKRVITAAVVIIAAAAAFFVIHSIFGTICLFKGITGIPCPGCGMTRALVSALRGDFKTAFSYHPLFPLAPVLAVFLALYIFGKGGTRRRKVYEAILLAICVCFIIVWIIRLALGWRA